MTHQAGLVECHQYPQTSRPFYLGFGRLAVYVLPAEVLDDTVLDETTPSLRQSCSACGLCYVFVLSRWGSDQYRAEVAATPDLANAKQVLLTEEHLCFARPWDIRLENKDHDSIRRILFACAQETQPIRPPAERISSDLLLDPRDDLVVAETIEVSTEDIERALISGGQGCSRDVEAPPGSKPSGAGLQQVLLRMVLKQLKQHLVHAHHQAQARSIQVRYSLVKQLRRWQRRSHQRVVNIARGWSEKRRSVVWTLIVGMPGFLVAAA